MLMFGAFPYNSVDPTITTTIADHVVYSSCRLQKHIDNRGADSGRSGAEPCLPQKIFPCSKEMVSSFLISTVPVLLS